MSDTPIRETQAARRRRLIGEFAGHLIALRNVDDAAKAVGVNVRTARRWLACDAFGEAYVELQRPTLEAAAKLARALTPTYLKALGEIVSNPQAADTARVAAAREIRESNQAYNEIPDLVSELQQRIRQLEQKLEAHR